MKKLTLTYAAGLALGLLIAQGPTPYFTDVPNSHPYFNWIQQMKELGLSAGCGPNQFCPDRPVTRAEMAVFLVRLHDLNKKEMTTALTDFGLTYVTKNGDEIITGKKTFTNDVDFQGSFKLKSVEILSKNVWTLDGEQIIAGNPRFTGNIVIFDKSVLGRQDVSK